MQLLDSNDSLSDKELEQLDDLLNKLGAPMNIEAIDGFFAALHCSPDLVMPSQYLGDILGDQSDNANAFESEEEAQEFFSLVMRQWNHVGKKLKEDNAFLPLLLEDEDGKAPANEWAKGFLQGIEYNKDEWQLLLDDEDHAGAIIPIFALAHEHSPDPELRPYKDSISDKRREDLIVSMAAGTMMIYRYFDRYRQFSAIEHAHAGTYRRETKKVGRNDPCPCGSGKKYKKCCGNPMFH